MKLPLTLDGKEYSVLATYNKGFPGSQEEPEEKAGFTIDSAVKLFNDEDGPEVTDEDTLKALEDELNENATDYKDWDRC